MDIKKQIKLLCGENETQESCGFVVFDKYKKTEVIGCPNRHTDKENYFKISAGEYLNIKLRYDIIAFFHSHPRASAAPSGYDRDSAEELSIPYYIYSMEEDDFFLGFPDSYNPPALRGRVYVEDIFQCSTLVKDYFHLKKNLRLHKWIENWVIPQDVTEANKLMISTFNKNTVEIDKDEMQQEDIIIFNIKPNALYHMGIFLGENELLHQPIDCLSYQIMMDERWLSKVYKVYRNKELL